MTGPEFFRWGPNFDWTEDRVKRLTELWAKGYSGREIAIDLGGGLSRSAVIGKAHRLKLPVREKGRDRENRRQTSKLHARNTSRAQRYGMGAAAHIAPRAAKQPAPRLVPPPDTKPACTVKFEALEPHHCRWPYDEGAEREFCGCNTVAGTSWCERHYSRVYLPVELDRKRRSIPQRQKTFDDIERENA